MRTSGAAGIAACAVVMAFQVGCGETASDGDQSASSTVCTTVGPSWWNQGFTDQTGTFRVEFAATPSAGNVDATVGLSNGAASGWSTLGPIVRFNTDGYIDARNGSAYTAVQSWPYGGGATYYIRIDVDIPHHTYSAWASNEQGSFGSWNQVANNYAFRTEQASVTKLNNVGAYVETGGTVQICGFTVNAESSGGCVASNAGGGFVNVATSPGVHGMIVEFDATPSAADMDGVVGVAAGTADDFSDFAASIRFYTNGQVEARDGDTYRAAQPLSYSAGETFSFRLLIDLENKTYTVFAHPSPEGPPVVLAENWKFRPQQLGVTQLDHVATVVDSSSGSVELCNPLSTAPSDLRYARFGNPMIAPSGDGAIVTELQTGDNETIKVDANGKTLGSPGFGIGGEPAVDASGNLYLASLFGSDLDVDAYSSSLAHLWSTSTDVGGGTLIGTAVAGSNLLVAIRQSDQVRIETVSTANGTARLTAEVFGDSSRIVAVGTGGWAVASPQYGSGAGYSIEAYGPDSGDRWFKTFPGNYAVSALAVGADDSVVFGGQFYGQTANFGDRTLYAEGNSEQGPFNSYFVALSPTGALRYSAQTGGNTIQDLDTNGTVIGVANNHVTQFPWVDFSVYDTAGNALAGCAECDVGLGHQGDARSIVVTDHRVYLVADEYVWFDANRVAWPFMFAYDF